MNKSISITFSNYFEESEISDLDGVTIGGHKVKTEKLSKKEEATGGLIWEGIVIFVASGVAGGFLGAIGQDFYNGIKEKLFTRKQKLRPQQKYQFTINIELNNAMAFFIFTELKKEDFMDAMKKAEQALAQNKTSIEKEGGHFDFRYNTKSKKWLLERNNSFYI